MPIDNKKVQTQPLPQILPKHPHRILYILLSILIFVLVSGAIIMYQIRMVGPVVESPPTGTGADEDLIMLRSIDSRSQSLTSEQGLGLLHAIKEKSTINK